MKSSAISLLFPSLIGIGQCLDTATIAGTWGTLNAINLNTGEYAWKIPLGEYPELAAKGIKNTGTENYGGPIVTAGGLLFIGATNFDRKFRAFDKFSGNVTPITYALPPPAAITTNWRPFRGRIAEPFSPSVDNVCSCPSFPALDEQ